MVMLVVIRDLGSSLMFFGGFLAMLYVATNRVAFPIAGFGLFALGAWFFANTVGHVQSRVDAWHHPFDPQLYDQVGGSFQIAQSLFAQADGGVWGAASVRPCSKVGDGPLLPAAQTDLIYAVIVNEAGLIGACALLLVYLLFVERGMRIAVLAHDGFSKLLAAGPDDGRRVPGLRDRRRRHARHPADRRDAPLRLLRRLVDRRELRDRRAAAARVGPRASRGACVNGPIVRVFGLVLVLFTVLVFFTTRWTVLERDDLRDNPRNKRALLEQERIARGAIIAADDSTLARSARRPDGTYTRRYPQASRFAQTVGYAYLNPGTAGLERRYNGELLGREQGLETALRRLQGKRQRGNDLRTALDPAGPADRDRRAERADRGGRRAGPAKRPREGRRPRSPTYDPNVLRRSDAQARLNRTEGAPLLNRVTAGLYPPGSTMKVMTAIAAIDSGRFTPSSTLEGRSGIEISGVPLANFGGEDFGRIDLTTALTNSVNTVWAQVAEQVGKATMGRYMRAARLLPQGRGRPAGGRAARERHLLPQGRRAAARAADRRVRRHRPRRHRSGRAARLAAADGDGRCGGRQRRAADAPVHRHPRDRRRRPHDDATTSRRRWRA